jgi:hypothetical protein
MIGCRPRIICCTRPTRSGQTHHAEPESHDADQPEREGNGSLRAIESASRHFAEAVVPAADRDREDNEREPDVV